MTARPTPCDGAPGGVRWRFTDRSDGDLCVALPAAELEARRAAIVDLPWTWLDQVHGSDVVVVRSPGDGAGSSADAAVTCVPGAVLAVHTADCAGVLLDAPGAQGPVIGAAHAGWRGLLAGVLQRTVEAMTELGAGAPTWRLGPCISGACYEFGETDLDRLAARYGEQLRTRTDGGAPALDLREGVRAALAEVGANPVDDAAADVTAVPCTSGSDHFSWRTRSDAGRQAALIWIEPA